MKDFEVRLDGLEAVDALFLRLTRFQALLRKPMNAALGEAKRTMQANVGSRKASDAMKVRVRKADTGMTGKVGPVGGKHRPGFLAAKFLETGTGTRGPRHKNVMPRSCKVMAIPSDKIVAERFGPQATIFTKTGRLRAAAIRRYGSGMMVFARSDVGMSPRPWFDRSVHESEGRVRERFRDALSEALRGN